MPREVCRRAARSPGGPWCIHPVDRPSSPQGHELDARVTAPYYWPWSQLEMPMSRVRSLAALSAVVALASCSSYRLVPLANIAPSDHVRVTVRGGRRVELQSVAVRADTLRGFSWTQGHREIVAIAVANLTTVEVLRTDRRSVGLVFGTALVLAVIYFAVGVHALGGPGS